MAAPDPIDVDSVLAAMRAGAEASVGGSRCHSRFFHEEGSWWREDFDEGALQRQAVSEAWMREQILAQPRAFALAPWSRHWHALGEALRRKDRAGARSELSRARAWADPTENGRLLAYWLDPPSPLDAEDRAWIASRQHAQTTAHALASALGDRRDSDFEHLLGEYEAALRACLEGE